MRAILKTRKYLSNVIITFLNVKIPHPEKPYLKRNP